MCSTRDSSPLAKIEDEKPVRVLHYWAVFDARPSKVRNNGGVLALVLISSYYALCAAF